MLGCVDEQLRVPVPSTQYQCLLLSMANAFYFPSYHPQEMLEARIAELEEALLKLQERVNQVSVRDEMVCWGVCVCVFLS